LENLDLRHAQSQLVIIDEIGKMECFSQRFTNDVTDLLSSPKMLIATIAMRGEGFISQVKSRSDCRLVTVTRENRDSLAHELLRDVLDQLR
jgi:nucleoside-triphosphatase